MKIGFSKVPATPAGASARRLAEALTRYAPEHEYVVDEGEHTDVDLYHYHGFRPTLPLVLRLGRVKAVVTVRDLNFLRYPQLYTLPERLFTLGAYRRALRTAHRVIALNRIAREELSERLRIDPHKIEVLMPLAAPAPARAPRDGELEAVRRKYDLPERFVLMLGTVEPRHHHETVFEALADDEDTGLVVCGRRTTYSNFLLGYARGRHMAGRVDFIYELSPEDLPALFRLAGAFAYLPDGRIEASIVPVVEALRAELPMVLSDTRLNREAAGNAALYVRGQDVDEVREALHELLTDSECRATMQERSRRRAELYSEYAVAQRLIEIYTAL